MRTRRAMWATFGLLMVLILTGIDCPPSGEDCDRLENPYSETQLSQETIVLLAFCGPEDVLPPDAAPEARLTITPEEVDSGRTVRFDASGSLATVADEVDATIELYEWDVDGQPGFERNTGATPVLEAPVSIQTPGQDERRLVRARVTSSIRYSDSTNDDGAGFEPHSSKYLTIHSPSPGANQEPTAQFTITPEEPEAGEDVVFDGSASSDPEGGQLTFLWDLDPEDGEEFETDPDPDTDPDTVKCYDTEREEITVRLRVTDPEGLSGEASRVLTVDPTTGGECASAPGFASRAARARPFTMRVRGRDVPGRGGRLVQSGDATSLRGVVFAGTLGARAPRASRTLRSFRRARFVARLDLKRRAAGAPVIVRATALATSRRRGGRACLRIAMRTRGSRPQAGRFRVLGGSGSAARVRARGRFTYRVSSGVARLRGRVRESAGPPRRLPRACRRLSSIR